MTVDAVGKSRFARYAVLQRLGASEPPTYAAFDRKLRRRVALRMLADDRQTLHAARARARLVHPHAVAVHEVGTHEGQAFMATDLAVGTTIAQWRASRPGARAVVAVALQVGAMLAEAHELGIVHGRLDADRIVIDDEGRATVFGFGLLRSVGPAAVDPRVDQYAMCALLRDTVGRSRWLASVFERGLASDPSERYESMNALVDALRQARRGAGSSIATGTTAAALALGAAIVTGWPTNGDCGPATGSFDRFAEHWRPGETVDCSDLDMPKIWGLGRPPPSNGGTDADFDQSQLAREQLSEALERHNAGDLEGTIAAAEAAVRGGEPLGWDSLVARAHVLIGDSLARRGKVDEGCRLAFEAYGVARRLADDLTGGEAAATLARCDGVERGDAVAGLRWGRHADALLARVHPGGGRARARLHATLAEIHDAQGERAEADAERAEAERLRRLMARPTE